MHVSVLIHVSIIQSKTDKIKRTCIPTIHTTILTRPRHHHWPLMISDHWMHKAAMTKLNPTALARNTMGTYQCSSRVKLGVRNAIYSRLHVRIWVRWMGYQLGECVKGPTGLENNRQHTQLVKRLHTHTHTHTHKHTLFIPKWCNKNLFFQPAYPKPYLCRKAATKPNPRKTMTWISWGVVCYWMCFKLGYYFCPRVWRAHACSYAWNYCRMSGFS